MHFLPLLYAAAHAARCGTEGTVAPWNGHGATALIYVHTCRQGKLHACKTICRGDEKVGEKTSTKMMATNNRGRMSSGEIALASQTETGECGDLLWLYAILSALPVS